LGEIAGEPVVYNPSPGDKQAQVCVRRFRYTEQIRTAQQMQRDYTFKNPRYDQQHSTYGRDLGHQQEDYERYDYPGHYKKDAAGKPFTATRLTSLRRDACIAQIEGDDTRIEPGKAFKLTGHPRKDLNISWCAVRVTHQGKQLSSQQEESADSEHGTYYSQEAELIPATADWKARIPPKLRIDGPQMASVTGPAVEEIYCDEWGRIKVQFPWDRDGENNERSSCWIRVSQNWAGGAWGHMAIPRIGQEVVVDFLDGDPDQPIVTGRTYHAESLPPDKLPVQRTAPGRHYRANQRGAHERSRRHGPEHRLLDASAALGRCAAWRRV
jgi:type VI secretion system secreted protein VgrG